VCVSTCIYISSFFRKGAVVTVKDKLGAGRGQLAALKRATMRLQEQINARRERLSNAGVDELGLIQVLGMLC
jgi:hypothetical protein